MLYSFFDLSIVIVNIQNLINLLRKLQNPPNYVISNKNKSKSVIKPETMEDHKIIFGILKAAEFRAHTYTPKEKKPQAYILRGPHFSTDVREIREELNEKVPKAKLIKVEHYETPY